MQHIKVTLAAFCSCFSVLPGLVGQDLVAAIMAANQKELEAWTLEDIITEEIDFNVATKAFKRLLRRQIDG